MAWYYPTHACGHAGDRVQLLGPHSGREYRLGKIKENDCPSCRIAAAKASAPDGLCSLKGSEKQIAWAEEIRADLYRDTARTIAKTECDSDMVPYVQAALEEMKQQQHASWWIDKRNSFNYELLKIAKEIKNADKIKETINDSQGD